MIWFPGEAALIRLWDTVEKLGSGLLSPMQIRREGRARAEVRRYELLAEEQARREIEEIAAGQLSFDKAGSLASVNSPGRLLAAPNSPTQDSGGVPEPRTPSIAVSQETQELLFRARVAHGREGLRRLANLRATVRQAEEEMENGANVDSDPAAPISDDWLASWREGAEHVSEADLQRLWARILKSEVSHPGSMSLRTLLFMRGIDRADAELIALLGSFILDGGYVLKLSDKLKEEGLGIPHLLALEDMGVLAGVSTGVGGLAWSRTLHPEVPSLVQLPGDEGLVLEADSELKVTDQCYVVTRVGREVVKLGDFIPNENYLTKAIEQWKSKKLRVQRGKIVSRQGDEVRLSNLRDV